MRLLIIRHGDPDYKNDCLTERGRMEAGLVADRLSREDITKIYMSPLGRARETAEYTLRAKGMSGEVCEWLREFPILINRPDVSKKDVAWDWLPKDWTPVEDFYSINTWANAPQMKEANIIEEYNRVVSKLDELIAEHGYVREDNYYRAERANEKTLAFFCHFGLECVLLSHLLNISPVLLWQGFCAPTASVTTLYTEERRKGVAYFRTFGFGDISHFYAAGESAVNTTARFCEMYDRLDQRHD